MISDSPEWVTTIESSKNATGPGLVALCRLLDEEGTPPALRELATRFVEANLYRADRPRARASDPETSQAAAYSVRGKARPGSAVHRILKAYAATDAIDDYREGVGLPPHRGITSREVETAADVRAAHKRTSELLADGLLSVVVDEWDGASGPESCDVVRDGSRVLVITEDGRTELARINAKEAAR